MVSQGDKTKKARGGGWGRGGRSKFGKRKVANIGCLHKIHGFRNHLSTMRFQ